MTGRGVLRAVRRLAPMELEGGGYEGYGVRGVVPFSFTPFPPDAPSQQTLLPPKQRTPWSAHVTLTRAHCVIEESVILYDGMKPRQTLDGEFIKTKVWTLRGF